ncbi:MAG: 2-C-methyl-D-erythritol 2,4-cyclodiphosphate synthase, partial [Defluviitaleaceae bacterium]|nr:2-C-methyl-D-erythritol 2,4-cyclodiphosphate synthase [Defluviitaleaceae bacterium]
PHENGLLGHSDADVLTHCVIDAILGAAKLGDIGRLFPDTDAQYKDVESVRLLEKIMVKLDGLGYAIGNIDATIVAEKPKLASYMQAIEDNLARYMNIDTTQISIKAKTQEKMGFEGREEGMSCYAICLIERKN